MDVLCVKPLTPDFRIVLEKPENGESWISNSRYCGGGECRKNTITSSRVKGKAAIFNDTKIQKHLYFFRHPFWYLALNFEFLISKYFRPMHYMHYVIVQPHYQDPRMMSLEVLFDHDFNRITFHLLITNMAMC